MGRRAFTGDAGVEAAESAAEERGTRGKRRGFVCHVWAGRVWVWVWRRSAGQFR